MNAVLLGTAAPDSPEWHALRADGIGASEIASVVGLSPYQSAFELWHIKAGNIPGPDPENPYFYWGHALEPVVAAKYAELHPEFSVATCGTYAHADRPWQRANPDRALHGTKELGLGVGVLEIKTTRYGDNWGRTGTADIPLHVRCQVMQQMDVIGVPFADVAVLIGGSDYREYRIEFDETDAATLRAAGAAFWNSLQAGDEPPIDASFSTYEAVRALHPEIDGEDVELPRELWDDYALSKSYAESATDAERKAKSLLLAALGTARRGLVNGMPVVRRQPGRNGAVSLYPITQKEAS